MTSQLLGLNIGPYRIVSFLGDGGTAEVFVGEHVEPLLSRRVAIKALRPELCQQRSLVERFMNEARALGRIRHPNVVDIYEVARLADGRVCLVMELLRGEPLRAYIESRGRLPVAEALGIAAQIASAMQAVHQQHIVHRDLKPDNVVVCSEPDGLRVRVVDFGVAKLLDGGDDTLTGTQTTLGTAAYMAPEQFQSSRDVDVRVDVYALGCVLYEMLTGEPPYPGRHLVQQMAGHAFSPIPTLAGRAEAPPVLDAILARMLAKHRDERFASMDEVLHALTDASRALRDDATVLAPMDPALFEEFADDEPLADRTTPDAETFDEAETGVSARALLLAEAPTAMRAALDGGPTETPTSPRVPRPVAQANVDTAPVQRQARWRAWLPVLAIVGAMAVGIAAAILR